MRRRSVARRTAAVLAVVAAASTLVLTAAASVLDFPRGLVFLVCAALAAAGVWEGVLRRGWGRAVSLALAVAAVGCGVLALRHEGFLHLLLFLAAAALVWYVAARLAFDTHVTLPTAVPPAQPVLFINPRSGDGKAARYRLEEEARARGIESRELRPGQDLGALVRAAIDDGADGLAMAGGDGSQAVVAAIAAEAGLPFACIPSGTRNHFALDLGVDRDDVVGALDAFVDGGEKTVDLADVNGRVFVNNVSLGVYAEAVQRGGYRQSKIRTLLATVPDVVGTGRQCAELRWRTPGGRVKQGAAVLLIGNGQYRLGGAAGAGTRPSVGHGVLGITVVDPPSSRSRGPGGQLPWRQFTTEEFRVESDEPVPVGIDGEAAVLDPPALFRSRPGALRVRIAPRHPGASPSAVEPVGATAALRALVLIAAGRDPATEPQTHVQA